MSIRAVIGMFGIFFDAYTGTEPDPAAGGKPRRFKLRIVFVGPNEHVLSMSATPIRSDGKPLLPFVPSKVDGGRYELVPKEVD